MNKQCINCKLTKNFDEFQTRKRNDVLEYLGNCRECERLRILKWKQNRSKEKKVEKLAELGITEEIPENHKHCTECLKVKKLEEFGTRKKKTGIFPKSWCHECEKNKKNQSDRKKGVQPKKTTRQCRYCKNEFPTEELSMTYYCINCRDDEVTEGNKRCSQCKEIKKLEEFPYRTAQGCSNPFPRSNCYICNKIVEYPRIRLLKAVQSLENGKKFNNTYELISCTPHFLKNWLEYQFDSKMCWENMGKYWHIDHVIPCSSFNLLEEDEQYKCFKWTNLRPLKGTENMSKSNKIIPKEILNQEIKVNFYKKQMKAQRLNERGSE